MAEPDVERSKRMLWLWIVALLVLVASAWLAWSLMLDDEPAVAEPVGPVRACATPAVDFFTPSTRESGAEGDDEQGSRDGRTGCEEG